MEYMSGTSELFHNDGNPYMMVLVGKSRSGKSYLLRYIMTHHLTTGKFKYGLAFVGTKFNNAYNWLPDKRVFEGFGPDKLAMLQKYIGNLENIVKEKGKVDPNFVLFDDLVGVLDNQSPWFENWMSKFRHTNTYVFFAVQYLRGRKSISPIMREQTDYAVMFPSINALTLDALYGAYGGWFENEKTFKDFLLHPREEHAAVLYRASERDDNYVVIKAPEFDRDDERYQFKF